MASNIRTKINKVIKALKAKGKEPLINTSQFYATDGNVCTKYTVHYGSLKDGCVVFGKLNLLMLLIQLLKEDDNE